jgi:D-alanyl-lipoteichoic acid acyltransferase DltB (MBOAT superfamily)
MAWNPAPVVLLLYLTVVDWAVGKALMTASSPQGRKALLALSVVNNLGALGVFKYADWLTRCVVDAAAVVGVNLVYKPLGLLLPVGLSFLVFQGMSYTIDVYRRELVGRRSLLDVLVFMTFFPHVVAGPIVRAADFLPQIDEQPRCDDATGSRALARIVIGLCKKLVIADFLEANLVGRVFADPAAHSGVDVVAAVVGYTLQIYYDFSAYSDIAIGTAALFGYVLKENFDKPYLASNLFDFWRRWHISLNTWLRDYLYVTLGGNRVARPRVLLNLFLTMLLAGAWHGAHGRFVVWGALHGIALCATRVWWWVFGRPRVPSRGRILLATVLTFVVVVELRIVFRTTDLSHAGTVFLSQFAHWSGFDAAGWSTGLLLAFGAAIAGHLLPHRSFDHAAALFARAPVPVRAAVLILFAILIARVASAEAHPFIYSRF